MISSAGYNDVWRIYAAAERDGVDYNLAFIGRDFTQVLPAFDRPTCAPCSTTATSAPAAATTGRRSRRPSDSLSDER